MTHISYLPIIAMKSLSASIGFPNVTFSAASKPSSASTSILSSTEVSRVCRQSQRWVPSKLSRYFDRTELVWGLCDPRYGCHSCLLSPLTMSTMISSLLPLSSVMIMLSFKCFISVMECKLRMCLCLFKSHPLPPSSWNLHLLESCRLRDPQRSPAPRSRPLGTWSKSCCDPWPRARLESTDNS